MTGGFGVRALFRCRPDRDVYIHILHDGHTWSRNLMRDLFPYFRGAGLVPSMHEKLHYITLMQESFKIKVL